MTETRRSGRFEHCPSERVPLVDGTPAALGSRAVDLQPCLVTHRDRVLSKGEVLERVWPGRVVEERDRSVRVSALREVLGADASSRGCPCRGESDQDPRAPHQRATGAVVGPSRLRRHARRVCGALLGAAVAMVSTTLQAEPAAPSTAQPPMQTQVHVLDGHRVTLDVYPAVGPLRGAAILSHGFTRSRQTLAGHAQALAEVGVLALTPDLPCTFDFRCNGRALAALVGLLRAGEAFGAPVDKVMLVGFSAGGLSSLLAADTPGVVGFVGLDPFDRTMRGQSESLGLTAARQLRVEALLLRAPPSSCNADAVAAPWVTTLPRLWRDELIAGASHCDFESPTDWMCRLACGDEDPARQQRVRQGVLEAAARWMP